MKRKILTLEVQDFMRVKSARLDLRDRHAVPICGANEQGKSSLINAWWWLIGGREFPHGKVVRNGANQAVVKGDLGDIVIEKVQPAEGSARLEIRSADGKQVYRKPQQILNELKAAIAFDPMAFAAAPDEAQAGAVRSLLGLDWTDLDRKYKATYEARTEANRELRRLEGALASIPEPGPDTPDAEISVINLLQEQRRRMEVQQERERRARATALAAAAAIDLREKVRFLHEEVLRAQQAHREAEAALEAAKRNLEESQAAQEAIPDPDVAAITVQIASAGEVNQAVQKKREHAAVAANVESERSRVAALSKDLDEIDAEKQRQVAAAKFPVEGLSFALDGTLIYHGAPFSQAADSAKLRTGVALGLALQPDLPVILIRQGSLLDEANLAMVCEMVEAADGQVLLEIVGDGVPGGFVIEDGEAHAVPAVAQEGAAAA